MQKLPKANLKSYQKLILKSHQTEKITFLKHG